MILWRHTFSPRHAVVTTWVTGKTIQYSTFVIQRLQTFVINFVTNAFVNVYYNFYNVCYIYDKSGHSAPPVSAVTKFAADCSSCSWICFTRHFMHSAKQIQFVAVCVRAASDAATPQSVFVPNDALFFSWWKMMELNWHFGILWSEGLAMAQYWIAVAARPAPSCMCGFPAQ